MIYPGYAKVCAHYLSGERPAFATTLVAILLRCYGADVLNWDSWTLELQVKDDFGVELERKTHDKIQALITVLTTTQAFSDPETFAQIVGCLNGKGISRGQGAPAPVDVAWAIAEIELADPQPEGVDPNNRWSKPIRRYIRVVLDDAGVSISPKSLAMAAPTKKAASRSDDAVTFAASWQSKQLMADEVDEAVATRMDELLKQLRAVGIPVETKKTASVIAPINNEPEAGVQAVSADPELAAKRETLRSAMRIAQARVGDSKTAEWTSDANRKAHTDKHAIEFGGEEGYLAAEREHSETPPEDSVLQDVRCRLDNTGKPVCAASYASASRGTLHVKTLPDGRTVTLFRTGPPQPATATP